MKTFLLSGLLLAFCFGLSAAANLRIAVVDTGRAFDVYYKTQEMAKRIAAKQAEFQKEIQDVQAEYQESNKEAQGLENAAKDVTLPADVRKEKDSALGLKVQDLKSMEDEVTQMGRQRSQEIKDELQRSHKEIAEEIVKVITDYASRSGYDLVLDNSSDAAATEISRLPYHSVKIFDITEDIITRLNASAPPTSAAADAADAVHRDQ